MVLVQVLINQDTNGGVNASPTGAYYTIPISGKCSIRVLHVQFHSSVGSGVMQVLRLQSDALIANYSPLKYITFMNNGQSSTNFDSSYREYHFQNVVLNGNIFFKLEVVSGTTLYGANNDAIVPAAGTYSCLLTLEVEYINQQFDSVNETAQPSSKTAGSLY